VKKLFPGVDGGVILRQLSKRTTKIPGPATYGPSFIGVADARTPVIIYARDDGQLLQYEYFGPMLDVLCFAIVENMNGTGTNLLQGASYFNRYVVSHLINVTAL